MGCVVGYADCAPCTACRLQRDLDEVLALLREALEESDSRADYGLMCDVKIRALIAEIEGK